MIKECLVCGKKFDGPSYKKYCGSKCRRKEDSKKRQHPPEMKVCDVCGKEFLAFSMRRKTCSDECSIEHERQWRNAYRKKYYKEVEAGTRTIERKEKEEGVNIMSKKMEEEFFKERERMNRFRRGDPEALERNAARAKQCGVSYGYYMGMKYSMSKEKFANWEREMVSKQQCS